MSGEQCTSVLYVSHFVTLGTLWNYARIRRAVRDQYDVYWVCHGQDAQRKLAYLPIETFLISDELLESWRPAMNGNGIVPGNGHIPTISFAQRHEYEHFWIIEYDVRFTGQWRDFFGLAHRSEADLISSFIKAPFTDESWHHWDSIDLPCSQLAYSFGPVRRVSRRLLEAVKELITNGYWAHNETLLPSICQSRGWLMRDLNDLARQQWGDVVYTPVSDQNVPGTFNYRSIASSIWGAESNKLHHPVKPIRWFLDRFGVRHGLGEALKSHPAAEYGPFEKSKDSKQREN